MSPLQKILKKAKDAAFVISTINTAKKNNVLREVAKSLCLQSKNILKANAVDIKLAARKKRSSAFIDRLLLDEKRIKAMSQAVSDVVKLPDPVGKVISVIKRPNGLIISKVRVPIGVIGIIYESRPNVTSDCISLCLKAGNVTVLRGGSDSLNTNMAIYEIYRKVFGENGLPKDSAVMLNNASHDNVKELLAEQQYINLIIPRGGEELIRTVSECSRIPVIRHYKGVCHVYVDEYADLKKALDICINAKVQRPGVCNAMETLLVNEKIAHAFLPLVVAKLQEYGVEIRGCDKTKRIIKNIKKATDQDWYEEYLDLILAVRIVKNVKDAIKHINTYGSKHSDSIITQNTDNAFMFLQQVDSAAVYLNASTRFTDGGEFGMGAEIGISTDKLHARGPMGLEELTTYKYIVIGKGQIRK